MHVILMCVDVLFNQLEHLCEVWNSVNYVATLLYVEENIQCKNSVHDARTCNENGVFSK